MIRKVHIPIGTTRNVTIVSTQPHLFAAKDDSTPPEGYIIFSEQTVKPGDKGYVIFERTMHGDKWVYYPQGTVN